MDNKKFNETVAGCIKANLKEGITVEHVQKQVKEALKKKKPLK